MHAPLGQVFAAWLVAPGVADARVTGQHLSTFREVTRFGPIGEKAGQAGNHCTRDDNANSQAAAWGISMQHPAQIDSTTTHLKVPLERRTTIRGCNYTL